MAFNFIQVIKSCDREVLKGLFRSRHGSVVKDDIWSLEPAALDSELRKSISARSPVWAILQHCEVLANNGGNGTIRSIVTRSKGMIERLDELGASPETAAVWLATNDETLFEYAVSVAHANKGLQSRSWQSFIFQTNPDIEPIADAIAEAKFLELVKAAISQHPKFERPQRLAVHSFARIVDPEDSHTRRRLHHVTAYAEMRKVTEDAFTSDNSIDTRSVMKVDRISVIYDEARRELDVVTIGAASFRRTVADAFGHAFFASAPTLYPLIRRFTKFEKLLSKTDLDCGGHPLLLEAKVDEIRLQPPGGGLVTFECRREDGRLIRDVYESADLWFGHHSPFQTTGWTVVAARLRLLLRPSKPGRPPRPRTVELRKNGRTNLKEHTDEDEEIARALVERWGLMNDQR